MSPNKSLFWKIDGSDFGRSIRWARSWINPLSAVEVRRKIEVVALEQRLEGVLVEAGSPPAACAAGVQNAPENFEPCGISRRFIVAGRAGDIFRKNSFVAESPWAAIGKFKRMHCDVLFGACFCVEQKSEYAGVDLTRGDSA